MVKGDVIELIVITPERQVLDEHVSSVVFAAHDGELGVLHNRAPLMCELGIGQLRYETGGRVQRLFIDGGFAQVHRNSVTILTQQAMPAGQITPEKVARAEQSIRKLRGGDPETIAARQSAQQRFRTLRRLRIAT